MLQVGVHDGRVVGAVPVPAGRPCDEVQPQAHGTRRWLPGKVADEGDRLAAVPQQPFVDRTPPEAAGWGGVERIEHAAVRLPAHEGQCRPSERQMPRGAPRRPVVGARGQRETRRGIVARGRNLGLRRGEGRASVLAHRRVVIAKRGVDRGRLTTASAALRIEPPACGPVRLRGRDAEGGLEREAVQVPRRRTGARRAEGCRERVAVDLGRPPPSRYTAARRSSVPVSVIRSARPSSTTSMPGSRHESVHAGLAARLQALQVSGPVTNHI